MYRSVITTALRMLRAHAKVETANLSELREEIERFVQQCVVCTQHNTFDPGGILAWVEVSLDRYRPTKVCVGGRYSKRNALLGLEELLGIIDDAENFVPTQKDRRGC